ncbi:MAG TPA: alanine--glyoxylate aminotransferase family protein [Candidatus Hydrogenedentes bacterium]|nr:alanine--glyoxylate aminotransferase family protein [Candidatus Hydrogenedentota bacterium]
MRKQRLFTPGPTSVPPEVLLAMAAPMTHHRQAAFEEVFVRVSEKLKSVFQTSSPVVILSGSGTAAMEAAVVNLLSAGDKAISVNGGKFGERWGLIGKAHGVEMNVIDIEWGTAVAPARIEEGLKHNPDTKAVFTTLNETSTTGLTDVKAIAEITANTDAVLVVDAVSAVCADELRMDDWGIDVVVAGSQKALMLPPGLAFAALGPKARAAMAHSTLPKFYLSFEKALSNLEKKTTPFTPAVSSVIGLDRSLDMILDEGMEPLWARHRKLAEATRAGVVAMGMALFAQSPSNAATAIKLPEGFDGGVLHKKLRDEYKVTCAGGQEHLKGRIERIAHMGYYDQFDMLVVLGAVELALKELGVNVRVGEGVAAAQRYFAGE